MGRPAKEPGEKLVEVPCKVSPEVAELIADIARDTDRYRGQIARKLIYRGLAAYLRDGSLEEPKSANIKSIVKNIPSPIKALNYERSNKKGGPK